MNPHGYAFFSVSVSFGLNGPYHVAIRVAHQHPAGARFVHATDGDYDLAHGVNDPAILRAENHDGLTIAHRRYLAVPIRHALVQVTPNLAWLNPDAVLGGRCGHRLLRAT